MARRIRASSAQSTGEWRDWIGIQHHRARYYNPAIGGWLSLDPFEGMAGRPMSLNGYMYVEGNVVNLTDSTGRCVDPAVCQIIELMNPKLLPYFGCGEFEQLDQIGVNTG
jgi:RHS repeat-associated protein